MSNGGKEHNFFSRIQTKSARLNIGAVFYPTEGHCAERNSEKNEKECTKNFFFFSFFGIIFKFTFYDSIYDLSMMRGDEGAFRSYLA